MNESRFIELLNLYVDHQLSDSEAAELEAEIARNPVRRTTYQQYCRMQKACTLLFEQERSHAPASKKLAAALRDADRKIVAFPEEQSRTRRGYYPVGLLAAAACAAFVFARFSPSISQKSHPETGGTAVAQAQAVPAPAPVIAEAAQPVAIPVNANSSASNARAGFYSVFVSPNTSGARGASLNGQDEDSSAISPVSASWMRDVQLTPLQPLSTSRITLKNSSVASSDERVLRSRKPVKDEATNIWAAYQFQR